MLLLRDTPILSTSCETITYSRVIIDSMIIHTLQEHGIVQEALATRGRYTALAGKSQWLQSDAKCGTRMFTDAYKTMAGWMSEHGLEQPGTASSLIVSTGVGSEPNTEPKDELKDEFNGAGGDEPNDEPKNVDSDGTSDDIVPIWAYAAWPDGEYKTRALFKPWNWPSAIRWKRSSIEERARHPITNWSPDHVLDLYEFSDDWVRGMDIIELDVLDDAILLSDFDGWSHVLNRWPVPEDWRSEWDENAPDAIDAYAMSREDIESTFDRGVIGRGDDPGISDRIADSSGYVQATMWEILPEYVRSISRIKQ